MFGIFGKIFLWFWLALIIFVVATLALTSIYLERLRSIDNDQDPRPLIHSYTQQARLIARQDGEKGLEAWLQQLDDREVIPILLLDRNGQDLLQRKVPESILLPFTRRGDGMARMGRGFRHRQGLIRFSDGSEYHLVPDYQGVTLYRMLSRPRVLLIPLLLASLISGVVCWWLARYLTFPIKELSLATRRFAAGEMDTRVAPSFGHRNDELAQLGQDFDSMAEKIQQLLASHMQLIADVSHELRSPLARILIALGLARQKGAREIEPELDRIETEAQMLDHLIGQAITISRLEAGSRPVDLETFNLHDLIQEIVDDADYEAQQNSCQITLACPSSLNVVADRGLMRSALENVIRNAVNYTAPGSTIDVAVAEIATDAIRVEVRDHGPGVPENMLARLFEPFVRVDPSRNRITGGFGLGLAITQRAVALHDGKVIARNHPGGGLSVFLDIPLRPDSQDKRIGK